MPQLVPDPNKLAGTPGSLKVAAPERAQRVSQAEMLRSMMASREAVTHDRTNVEVTRNAQGKPQVKVAVSHSDPDVAFTTAARLYDMADMMYPYEVVEKPQAAQKG